MKCSGNAGHLAGGETVFRNPRELIPSALHVSRAVQLQRRAAHARLAKQKGDERTAGRIGHMPAPALLARPMLRKKRAEIAEHQSLAMIGDAPASGVITAHPLRSVDAACITPRRVQPDHFRSHLAISLAIAAAQSGRRVYYGTLADLITSLEEASLGGRLSHRLNTLIFPSVLVVGEIGYLPISRTGAMLFFQLMSRRYERASTVLTSNKSFEEWGEIFGDEVMASALIDRLVHHCHIVNIRGNSYRMKNHAALAAALRHDTDPPARSSAPRRATRREAAAR